MTPEPRIPRSSDFAAMYHYLHSVELDETDMSGAMFHGRFLELMNRARADLLGRELMCRMWEDEGIGFAVSRCDISFRSPARFGESLTTGTSARVGSPWRLLFSHLVVERKDARRVADGVVEIVCVDRTLKLVRLPDFLVEMVNARGRRGLMEVVQSAAAPLEVNHVR